MPGDTVLVFSPRRHRTVAMAFLTFLIACHLSFWFVVSGWCSLTYLLMLVFLSCACMEMGTCRSLKCWYTNSVPSFSWHCVVGWWDLVTCWWWITLLDFTPTTFMLVSFAFLRQPWRASVIISIPVDVSPYSCDSLSNALAVLSSYSLPIHPLSTL